VRHTLSHFELRLDVLAARVPAIAADGFLVERAALADQALPSVMRKCVAVAAAP
jgi:adenine-specific DNA glycosylase